MAVATGQEAGCASLKGGNSDEGKFSAHARKFIPILWFYRTSTVTTLHCVSRLAKDKTDKHKYYFICYSYGAEIIENYEGRGMAHLSMWNHDEFLGNGSDMCTCSGKDNEKINITESTESNKWD